ncbi:MAG: hypothetical protein E4H10_08160 [Bacteroidia bacterium]|nr:MAG: hypothetical protein E4H10_08160 [Bacteroidia bacterium]
MEKFLIEVPHGEDKSSCRQAIQVFLSSGSHFVTNAEWGCMDGDHKAWLMVETENKKEAMRILPAAYQQNAKIIKLHKFTRQDIEQSVMDLHADNLTT